MLLLAAGAAVFALTAVLQLARLHQRNGVWLEGLASRVVVGGATTASALYLVALDAAAWSADDKPRGSSSPPSSAAGATGRADAAG